MFFGKGFRPSIWFWLKLYYVNSVIWLEDRKEALRGVLCPKAVAREEAADEAELRKLMADLRSGAVKPDPELVAIIEQQKALRDGHYG